MGVIFAAVLSLLPINADHPNYALQEVECGSVLRSEPLTPFLQRTECESKIDDRESLALRLAILSITILPFIKIYSYVKAHKIKILEELGLLGKFLKDAIIFAVGCSLYFFLLIWVPSYCDDRSSSRDCVKTVSYDSTGSYGTVDCMD